MKCPKLTTPIFISRAPPKNTDNLLTWPRLVSTRLLLWHVIQHAGFLAQLQWFEGPRLRTRDNTCLPGAWYDILLYNILAALDNLKIVTWVNSVCCYCLNLEPCQRQLRNICWLRLLVIFLSTLRVRCSEQTTRTKFWRGKYL